MSTPLQRLTVAVGRIARILKRRHLDGRLPEPTAQLLHDVLSLQLRSTSSRLRATVRPSGRHTSLALAPSCEGPGRWRRWNVGERLDSPLHDLTHQLAETVTTQLTTVGLEPFLIDHDRHRIHLGLPAHDRQRALVALQQLTGPSVWYLRWRRGRRWHLHQADGRHARRAARAESWEVFRCAAVGPGLVAGPERAVTVSFWVRGTSGRLERLGYRGLHRREVDAAPTVEHVDGHEYPGTAAFPVGRALTRVREPIDVVYTWVDGDDPTWRQTFDEWKRMEHPDHRGDHAAHPSRYSSRDELRFSLRSLWLNAGWVRKIYVVTADQEPSWMTQDDRLQVVSHREILPSDALPTFNSHAIESRLHHIDGLAEHFLYFNDDMFLGRPVAPEQFFTPNGISRYFESDARVPTVSCRTDLAVDTAARRGQQILDEEFGAVVTHKLHHAPYALRRSVMAEVEERFPAAVKATTSRRFRHPEDLSIPSAFAHHYGFMTGRALPGDLHVGYENLGSRRLGLFLRRVLLGRDFDAFCINETEHWESDPQRATAQVRRFLEQYFPLPSPWEGPTG